MRRDNYRQVALQVSIALTAGMFSIVPVVYGAPVGGSSTTAQISYSNVTNSSGAVVGQNTNITSQSVNNVIDWHDFSVAKGETVQFDGGAKTNNYMNIVTGANTSDINGAIKGGNEVYLINPNGIIFGKDASVSDVGSFYASTREVAVTDAVNAATAGNMGALITAGNSTSGAAMDIVNMGKISADKVVLEGENIRLLNSADITAANGVTLRADEGYIHVGSANGTGGAGYTSEKLTANGAAATVEQYTLVDSSNWNTTLGTGAAVSGKYMLSENIDASDTTKFGTNNPFKTVTGTFSGKLDGNFYEVSNISGAVGLFTNTQNATIENLGVKKSSFSNTTKNGAAGAIVSEAGSGTVLNNVYNDNSTVDGYNDTWSGGLVGNANGVTITNSYNTGKIYNGDGGGLIGRITSGTNKVNNSYSTGSAYGLVFNNKFGGTIEFDNVLGSAVSFYSAADTAPTGKNSLVISTNLYEYADAGGSITSASGSSLDKTTLATYTTNVLSLTNADITDTGGLIHSGTKLVRPTWRIYEGKTEPVLTAFQKGIKTTDYKYEYFDSSNVIDANALKYNNGANNGQDMTAYTYTKVTPATTPVTYVDDGLVYNGETLKIVDSSGNAAASNATTNVLSDASTVFKTAANSASTIDTSHVFYNAAGQRNATYTPPKAASGTTPATPASQNKLAFIWSDQNGYDLVGNNISIAPRRVTLTNNLSGQTIVKEYDGSYDAKSYVPTLFNGTSTTSSGILSVDSGAIKVGFDNTSNPTAIFVNRGGTTGDANVGADKQVLVNGKIQLTDASGNAYTGSNYVIVDSNGTAASSVQLNTTIDAAIYQRQLQVSFNGTGITKTYDKDEFVKDSNGNRRSFGQSDFTLNTGNIVPADVSNVNLTVATTNNAQYIDKTTGQVQVNVGTHDVALGGVTLTGTAAKNYTLVDASGNPIYSELGIVTGFQQQGSPIGTGGGTFYATGDITLRSLGDTGYKWFKTTTNGTPNYLTAGKEYDGTSAYADPGTYYVSNAGSSAASAATGMVAGDNLDFRVTSAEFTVDSTNVNSTAVRDANTTSTPQGVRYTVTVSGSAAGNYTFDSAAAIAARTAVPLSNGGTAKVMGEGNITPRTIWVTAPQASVADKTYDGDAYVKDANGNSTFDLTSGYLQYANSNTYQQLVSGDGSSIVINGLYQAGTNSAGYSYAGEDVNYDATNTTNPVLAKDIVYTAKIMQNNQLSTNYVFNINNSNQATFNGKGTIKPVQLGAITFGNISKTYDGSAAVTNTNNTTAPQYTDDIIKINTPAGIISTESISDVFYVDSNGNLDSTGAALLANGTFTANYGDLGSGGFTLNSHVKRDPQNLSTILPRDVEYAGISSLMKNHNYVLPATTAASDKVYGSGTINPFLVTDKSWIKLDRNSTPITKVYDGYDTITSPMSYLNTTGNNKANATVTTPAGKVLPGLASTVAGAKYSSEHSNGNTAQDVIYTVDFLETGDYGIDSSLKNSSGQVELTLTGDGLITQKHIIANTPKDPNVTKTYDATDAISKTGNALVDISSGILPIDQSRVTNGTTAKYIANANGAAADASTNSGDKTVEYTLALNGDTYHDYLLDDGNGNTTFTGAGTIDKRNLVITGNTNHNKQYDGTSTVTDMPSSLSGFTFGDAQDTTVLGRDNFDITQVSGLYGSGNTDAAFATNPNVGSKDVQYSGFFTALGSKAKNYTVNGVSYNSGSTGTAYGSGIINPATFNGIFVFRLKPGITQTYCGYADVGHEEANQQAFQESWIDLDSSGVYLNGTTITGTPDITLRNGAYTYIINSATYNDADAGSGKDVQYNITLTPTTLANYGITSSSAVPLDNQPIHSGVITAREVTVDLTGMAKAGLTKYYDGTDAIYNNDNKAYSTDNATGTVLQGNAIVTLETENTASKTGILNGVTNVSTGAYTTNVDAGPNPNKTIEYTVKISGDKLSNYIFKYANGNVLYDYYNANGPQQMTPITTNNNTINAFGAVVTANPISKVYDGTTAVSQTKAQGALQLLGTNPTNVSLLNSITGNTGEYVGVNVDPDAQGNPATHVVHYTGLDIGNTNYKLVDASGQELGKDANNLYKIDGTGIITPAPWNGTVNINLKDGINQIYSGYDIVGKEESTTSATAIDNAQRSWVDLSTSGITDNNGNFIALTNGDYDINSAIFTAGPDAGKNKEVKYEITLKPILLSNYTNIPTTIVNQTVTKTNGEIKAREVFVDLTTLAKNGLTKNYDATGAIYNNDNKAYSTDSATGTILTGNSIIEFTPVDTINHTGLVKGTNASTGVYTPNYDAGSGKTIEYTADIAGDNLSNYIFKDASGNTLYDNQNGLTQMTPLTTNNNTINAFGVVVTADRIAKPYDATDYVAPTTAQNALHLGSAVGNDVVSLQNPAGISARYVGVNVDDDGDGTPDIHTVNYTGLDLGVTGSVLTNYQLVDSNGNALSSDTNGLYKFAGTGIINPYKLTAGDVTINIDDASKTYDATKEVWKGGSQTNLTNNYITDHYVTIPNTVGGTQENLVFTSYHAAYNQSNATGNSVNPATQVDYRLGLSNANYDFSALRAAGKVNSSNEWVASTGGTIDKAVVTAGLTNNPLDSEIVKTYDGDAKVIQPVRDKVSVTGLLTAKDGTVLNVDAINAQYDDKNVARDASGNVVDKDVYYQVELFGAAKDNYKIVGAAGAVYRGITDNTGTLTGKGRIMPKELTIDFKLAERGYNGKDNVNTADIQVEKFNGLLGTDSITLDSTAMSKIAGTYGTGDSTADFTPDGDVKRNGDAVGYKSVKYEHVADAYADYLARNLNTDAANYTVTQDTFYKESDNKGKINPIVLADIKAKWQGVDKVYDATANVLNPANTMKLVTTDTAGQEIELTYTGADSGVYVDSNGVAQKDVGNHGLKYNVTEVKKNLGNYQLADSAANSARRDWFSTTAADNADGQAVTGEITPLTLNVIAQNGFHKIYDGNTSIADSEKQEKIGFSPEQMAVLQKDIDSGEISYDLKAEYKDSDANVAPGVIRNQKDIAYSLTLKGNTKGNYILQGAVNDVVTDTAKLGDIEQRKIYVDPLEVTGIDKVYDTTTAMPDDYSSKGRFALRPANDTTGVVSKEDVQLDFAAIQGAYDSEHVQRDGNGNVIPQNITFNNFKLTGTANLANYIVDTDSLTGSGTISPAPLTVAIKQAPTKIYDGETSLAETYTANKNLDVQGWLQEKDKVDALLTDVGYTDANAGTNKEYSYQISLGNGDYELTQGKNMPDMAITDNGQSGTVTAYDGTITPRTLTASVIKEMTKEYDGTADGAAIENPADYILLSNNYLSKDKDSLGLTAVAVYDNANAGKAEDTDELAAHTVTYTLNLSNGNYELADSSVSGAGTIYRKGLNIVAEPVTINAGEKMPAFSGSVEGLVADDSSLSNSFTFAPLDATTNNRPGTYAVYGWYNNRFSGNLGLNYTFAQDSSNDQAFTVNYISDSGNPDVKITPNRDVYQQISHDMSSGFGDNGMAAIEYVDKNGRIVGRENVDSGEIHGTGLASAIAVTGDTPESTSLANIGIAGGDIVNLDGADAASLANIEVDGDGSIVNLQVFSINGDEQSSGSNSAVEIVSNDKAGDSSMEIVSSDGANNSAMEIISSDNAADSSMEIVSADGDRQAKAEIADADENVSSANRAGIQIVDEAGNVLEEENEDKAEKEEKEGEIAIESSDSQQDEIELKVEGTGVNAA